MDVRATFSGSEEKRPGTCLLSPTPGMQLHPDYLLERSGVPCMLCLRIFWQRADWHRSELAGTILTIKKHGKL